MVAKGSIFAFLFPHEIKKVNNKNPNKSFFILYGPLTVTCLI
ncbi:hypothetical protein BACUNI_04386 [Bacteroides uniformis ATCC 8492]|uniref:Uncharacterized protein n=1 Tax=Bacteroides uniformis (strain ATCC 8492 / DSM 6597 / CCUG 4942 / CIP 103695 / JCM 5828 / KCTC 5204 / NCTC 13054 / VPI 0061) TaxID=411479 RepID=A0ABC9N584_BACUC|nr:hypothetical protein BACUNI_04386 [Bacteroides uniformis ATCC 8492]